MHKWMQKNIEQMPHILTKKCPPKKQWPFFKKIFLLAPLPLNEFRAGMDMGKKRWLLQKTEKEKEKELFCATHTVFSYGGWQQD